MMMIAAPRVALESREPLLLHQLQIMPLDNRAVLSQLGACPKRLFVAPRPFHHQPLFRVRLAAPVVPTRRPQAHGARGATLTLPSRLPASSPSGMLSAPPPARARLPPFGGSSLARSPACSRRRPPPPSPLGPAWLDPAPTPRADTSAGRSAGFPRACSGPGPPPPGSCPVYPSGRSTGAHSDRVPTLLGDRGGADNPGQDRPRCCSTAGTTRRRTRPPPGLVAPRRPRHQMLRRLPRGLHAVGTKASAHRLDALALAPQQAAPRVVLERLMAAHMLAGPGQGLPISTQALLLQACLRPPGGANQALDQMHNTTDGPAVAFPGASSASALFPGHYDAERCHARSRVKFPALPSAAALQTRQDGVFPIGATLPLQGHSGAEAWPTAFSIRIAVGLTSAGS